jgi:hypothetical protein
LQSRSAVLSMPLTSRSNMIRRSNPGGMRGSTSTVMTPGGLENDRRGQKIPELRAAGTQGTPSAV